MEPTSPARRFSRSAGSTAPASGSAFDNVKVTLASTGSGKLVAGQHISFSTPLRAWQALAGTAKLGPDNFTPSPSGGFAFTNDGTFYDGWDDFSYPDELAFLLSFGLHSTSTRSRRTSMRWRKRSTLRDIGATRHPEPAEYSLEREHQSPSAILRYDFGSGNHSIFNTTYDVAHVQNSAIINHLAELSG